MSAARCLPDSEAGSEATPLQTWPAFRRTYSCDGSSPAVAVGSAPIPHTTSLPCSIRINRRSFSATSTNIRIDPRTPKPGVEHSAKVPDRQLEPAFKTQRGQRHLIDEYLSQSVSNADTKKCIAAVFSSTRKERRPKPFMMPCKPLSITSHARGGRNAPSNAPIIPTATHRLKGIYGYICHIEADAPASPDSWTMQYSCWHNVPVLSTTSSHRTQHLLSCSIAN